jgi:hypothetical protein
VCEYVCDVWCACVAVRMITLTVADGVCSRVPPQSP